MRILLYLAIGYALLVGFMALMQRNMLYFPDPTATIQAVPLGAEGTLEPWPGTGEAFRGYVRRPLPHPASARGTVVVFHGNAGSARDRAYYTRALEARGYRVVLAEYPGYGGRAGAPSEKAFIEDGRDTARQALAEFGGPLWLWGESLGAAVAAGVAADRTLPVAGVALITPWDRLTDLAQSLYWYVPARWLLRDRYDTIAALRDYDGAVAVLVAEQDEIIPARHSQRLYETLPGLKKRWLFAGAGHNTWPADPRVAWWDEVLAWFEAAHTQRALLPPGATPQTEFQDSPIPSPDQR
jgi:alpha-beta hydrolase superfamily lysophospholipase